MMMTGKFGSTATAAAAASIMMNCHAVDCCREKDRSEGEEEEDDAGKNSSSLQLLAKAPAKHMIKSAQNSCNWRKIEDCRRRPSKIQLSNGLCFVVLTLLIIVAMSSTVVTAANIGKYFTRSPQNIVAPPGDRVTFQCETNIPAEQVRWKLNGRWLDPANETDIRFSWNGMSVKVSKNRERFVQQVGDYQCVAEFGAEALTSLPAQLTIAHMDPFKAAGGNKTLTVVEDNTVAILCDSPYSNPLPFIQFYKDGQPLETDVIGNLMLTDSGVLLIHNVTVRDGGSYGCSATNHITSDTFVSPSFTNLQILPRGAMKRKAPEFVLKPKSNMVIPAEGNATLECIAVGNPPPSISFRRLRAPLSTMNGAYKASLGAVHLINVGLAHEGDYVCEAHNNVGETISTLSTIVLNSMPNITKEPKNLVVEEGGAAVLDCITDGLPKPRVYWVFNGHNVQSDGNIQITDRGLRITKVEKKHAGLFQCFATNQVGTVTSPAELKVMPKMITAMANDSSDVEEPVKSTTPPATRRHHHGQKHHHNKNRNGHNKAHRGKKHKGRKNAQGGYVPPSKPVINRISEESVMVRWTASPNSGGYPIQFYKIQYKELGGRRKHHNFWHTIDDDIPPHIHSYEVKELTVGQSYKFRILAVYSNNDNREGEASDKVTMSREGLVRRPTFSPIITNAAPHNGSTIRLQWKHMRAEGGGLDGYFIYYRESTTASDYAKVTVLGSDTETYYISHLKPGTAYLFKIQAFNRDGASNFSTIVSAKTLGTATTEKPDETRKKQPELIIPDEEPPATSDNLYLLLGCIFAAFWIVLCITCLLCYKCKQKRAEEEAKYPCEMTSDIEAKTIPNGHTQLNGHALNGFLPTISSHLEKETSFVVDPHHNNNRPISPSQLELEELATFKSLSLSLERRASHHYPSQVVPESRSPGNTLSRDRDTPPSRSNSLQRKKHNNHHHHNHQNNAKSQSNLIQAAHSQSHLSSLKRGVYMSCSIEDLDGDMNDVKNSKVFPKEHYKHSRKHSRKRNSMGDG